MYPASPLWLVLGKGWDRVLSTSACSNLPASPTCFDSRWRFRAVVDPPAQPKMEPQWLHLALAYSNFSKWPQSKLIARGMVDWLLRTWALTDCQTVSVTDSMLETLRSCWHRRRRWQEVAGQIQWQSLSLSYILHNYKQGWSSKKILASVIHSLWSE